jgi:hypothetical protein
VAPPPIALAPNLDIKIFSKMSQTAVFNSLLKAMKMSLKSSINKSKNTKMFSSAVLRIRDPESGAFLTLRIRDPE